MPATTTENKGAFWSLYRVNIVFELWPGGSLIKILQDVNKIKILTRSYWDLTKICDLNKVLTKY